jgi:hypothetical protein
MSKGKRFKAEQIVHKLREADVLIGQGLAVPEVIRASELASFGTLCHDWLPS